MAKHYKCDICSKKFSDKYNLSSHMHTHSNETPFKCPQCPYQGKTKKYLARHTKQVHKELTGQHKCNVCGKFFLHPSNLKVHAMVHSGEKPHECKVCGKTFRVTYSLNTHMLIHTNEKPFACSFCDYACRDSSTLRKHQNKHMGLEKIYQCKICNKGYKSRAALKIHIAETHLELDMRKFPCTHCDKMFKNNGHRQTHIEVVHKRSLVCNCPICGRRLVNRNNLSAHMRTHLDERPFSCTHEGCNVRFKDKNSLTKHTVIHNPSMQFPCSYCGRKFARKTHRKDHERVMHVERIKNVECDYCGSKFYTKNYLIKHIQTKHVYKQVFKYICDTCGLVTHNKPSIVMHLKYGHTNDYDVQCKICDNKIVYKKHMYLKNHYLKTHNIRYKITRKGYNKSRKQKEVEVKVEPIEADSYEEIQLLDVKHENEDIDESLDYSKSVLSEDIAASVLSADKKGTEVDFDQFFIRHVFAKQEDKTSEETNTDGIDKEQNEYVKNRIKTILKRTEKIEKAKIAQKKRKQEEKERVETEKRERVNQAKRERVELEELRRVRVLYNERMKAALDREREKKEKVKIKYFKKIPESTSKNIENTDKIPENLKEKSNLVQENCVNEDSIETSDLNKLNNDSTESNDIQENNVIDNEFQSNSIKNNIQENFEVNNDKDGVNTKDMQIDLENKHIDNDLLENDNYKSVENHLNIKDVYKDININEKHENEPKLNTDESNRTESHQENVKSLLNKEAKDKTDINEDITDQNEVINTESNEKEFLHNELNNINNVDIEIEINKANEKEFVQDNLDRDSNEKESFQENESQEIKDKTNKNEPNVKNNEINKDLSQNTDEDEKNTSNNEINKDLSQNTDEDEKNTSNNEINKDLSQNTDEDEKNTSNNEINKDLSQNTNEDEKNTSNNEINKHLSQNTNENEENTSNNEINKDLSQNTNKDENNPSSDDDQPLLERRKRYKRNTKRIVEKVEINNKKSKKMEFKTYQCYVCFKLYQTKEELTSHCEEHFDICHSRTLSKCPLCEHVSHKGLAKHMRIKHNTQLTTLHNTFKDDGDGSGYNYNINGTVIQVIPSINALNKTASNKIDKDRRDLNDKVISKSKLVKCGKEWIVEKETMNIEYDYIPELNDRDLSKLKVTDTDVDRLGQLSYLVKKKGLKMMFPCFNCDKVCQNFSGLKLHQRRHEANPKPFKPRVKRDDKKATKKIKLDKGNRHALPKPILNKHKCDDKLKEFFESNIRGGDIEFWQFLKIYNRMNKEKVNDFNDLESRTDFGNHLDYYKDKDNSSDESNDLVEKSKNKKKVK